MQLRHPPRAASLTGPADQPHQNDLHVFPPAGFPPQWLSARRKGGVGLRLRYGVNVPIVDGAFLKDYTMSSLFLLHLYFEHFSSGTHFYLEFGYD
ncbi:hypothetical protein E2C01_053569 [Portunus trituberculatus]|uniref:Uncharacterized protein n=1 Tax=Portunus trituberculatus TaxID=210409 RepID=A0A5B7GQF9_PORTR|nr:hypothetical protein [Portunus trituberculatus]